MFRTQGETYLLQDVSVGKSQYAVGGEVGLLSLMEKVFTSVLKRLRKFREKTY
jgi:hypothetical protein